MAEEFNHRYLADQALRLGGRMLDFGCGHASVLRLLLADGADAYGADVFFAGMDWTTGPVDLVQAGTVREIEDGRLPFADGFFDTIVSDQVLEHVEDLAGSLAEMARVLKPGGRMYHQYPTLELVREAHTAVPWSHRLRSPQPRTAYLRAARAVGLGKHVDAHTSADAWATHFSRWIDDYCHYRPRREIERLFAAQGFRVTHREIDYCLRRAADRRALWLPIYVFPRLAAASFRYLGFDCIEAGRAQVSERTLTHP